MINTLLRTSIITTLFLVSHASYAEIYKWVDGSGKVHYSQTPPATTQAENISYKIHTGTGKSQDTILQTESKTPDSLANKDSEKTPNPVQNFCQQQQGILQQLLSNPVVKWNDGNGEQLLNAQQRQAKIDEYKASVTTACENKTTNDVDDKAKKANDNNTNPSSPSMTREMSELLKALER